MWCLQIRRHLRHRVSYSSCAQVSPCCSLFCAYTYLPHHSAAAVSFLAYHTFILYHSPHFLGLPSISIDWFFMHLYLDIFPFYHLCFIHSFICIPVVIVISAQYHNTNFTFLFSFHVPPRINQNVDNTLCEPIITPWTFAPHLPWE